MVCAGRMFNNINRKKMGKVISNERPSSGSRTRVCACCGKSLPISEFYQFGFNRTPDKYCKVCRRAASSGHRSGKLLDSLAAVRCSGRSLLTQESDPARRMELILQARKMVKESILRKRARLAEEEDRQVNRELDRADQLRQASSVVESVEGKEDSSDLQTHPGAIPFSEETL